MDARFKLFIKIRIRHLYDLFQEIGETARQSVRRLEVADATEEAMKAIASFESLTDLSTDDSYLEKLGKLISTIERCGKYIQSRFGADANNPSLTLLLKSINYLQEVWVARGKNITDAEFDQAITKDTLSYELDRLQGLAASLNQRGELASVKEQNLRDLLGQAEGQLSALGVLSADMTEKFNITLGRLDKLYEDKKSYLEQKQIEIDKSFGIASGKILAGGYEKQAYSEKISADWLRAGAILCLAIISVSVSISIYHTTQSPFDLSATLFRLAFSIVLSIPAAYLARESAKHRQQQYNYLQMSLDLNAIGPYLASLPDSEQHKLKATFARKVFGPRHSNERKDEGLLFDSHELLIKLLDKIELKTFLPAGKKHDVTDAKDKES